MPVSGAPVDFAPAHAQAKVDRAPLDAYADPSQLSAEELETRRQFRLEQARRAKESYRQHPPYSRPLRENEDLLVPDQVAPTVRPLSRPGGNSGPSAVVRQTQDCIYLRPGTVATVGLEASADGAFAQARVTSAALVRGAGNSPAASAPLMEVAFSQGGPVLTASFTAPAEDLGSYTGDLLLRVEAEVGSEHGSLVYAFVYTGDPPAAFTGATADRLEAGSVVFEAEVDVQRPGRYRIQGRVDDSAGKPLALARYDGELSPGRAAVPLVLFGKIARDEAAVAPFVLRDCEGFRLLDGAYPDRETMAPWPGPYRSRAYRAEDLSPAAWDGTSGPAPRAMAP